MSALAVALAGLAAAIAVGNRSNLVRARIVSPDATDGRGDAADPGRAGRRGQRELLGVSPRNQVAVAIAAGAMAGFAAGGPGLAALLGAAVGLFVAFRVRMRSARRGQDDEKAVAEACLLLAAELRSGAHPRQALSVVADDWPDLFGSAARRAEVGGDVSSALRDVPGPGRSALSAVAAGWQVSERTGAALSDVLTAVADSLRADAAARKEAEAQLSTVRVTARLLAVLPVGTLLLLSGGDGAAVQFLLRTPYGLACLAGAVLLVAAGLWWIDRLVRSAATSSWS